MDINYKNLKFTLLLFFIFFVSSCTERWAKFNNTDYFSYETHTEAVNKNYQELCNAKLPEVKNKKSVTIISHDFRKAISKKLNEVDFHWSFKAILESADKRFSLFYDCGFFESIFSNIKYVNLDVEWNVKNLDSDSFADIVLSPYELDLENISTDYVFVFYSEIGVENYIPEEIINVKNGKRESTKSTLFDVVKVLEKNESEFLKYHEFITDTLVLIE